jgi:hypothetical protein
MEGNWTSTDVPVVIMGQVHGPPGCSSARQSVISSCRSDEKDPPNICVTQRLIYLFGAQSLHVSVHLKYRVEHFIGPTCACVKKLSLKLPSLPSDCLHLTALDHFGTAFKTLKFNAVFYLSGTSFTYVSL